METTDEAVPTMTSPTTQSRATDTSRTVEIATRCPPTRSPVSETRARCPSRPVIVPPPGGDTAAGPPGRGRAPPHGPTPDARHQSSSPGTRSGGGSRELRHRQEVAVEDAEAQRAEESAQDPEPHD